MKLVEYTLPEWVFLDGQSHEGDSLEGRTVILHVRSHSVIEIIVRDDGFVPEEGALSAAAKKHIYEYGLAII